MVLTFLGVSLRLPQAKHSERLHTFWKLAFQEIWVWELSKECVQTTSQMRNLGWEGVIFDAVNAGNFVTKSFHKQFRLHISITTTDLP